MRRAPLLLALLACTALRAATEITYRGYVEEMESQGIDVRHVTDESVAASYGRLVEILTAKLADERKGGKAALLRSVLRELEDRREASPLDRRAAYVAALRGLYAVEAEPFEDAHPWWNWISIVLRSPARFWTRAPRLTEDALDMTHAEYVRVEKPRHAIEAQGLVDASGARVSLDSLEGKTIREIADLDVAADHPTWLQEKERSRVASTAWERIERRVEGLVDRSGTTGYRLDTARRVLFLGEVKKSATSPKLDAEDVFGFKWKVKFGNQTHPEPIASRLFALLGQKFVDLVYTNRRGGRDLVLILPRGGGVRRLRGEFAEGHYEFDLTPYVDVGGILTEVRGKRLIGSSGDDLAPLPEGARIDPDDLVGRAYLTFRESEVEFQGGADVYDRVGPVAKNFAGAEDDRGERAGLIANMWVNNFDAKDENSRTIVIPEPEGGSEVLEIYHDLGGTLGDSFGSFGHLNELKTGEDFLGVGRKNLKFRQFLLYRPKAWTKMTAADGLWMARKVASVTKAQIEEAVAHSFLPAFVQEVYVYKIMDRRDRIADAYGLSVPDRAVAPSTALDLTPGKRAALAVLLGLELPALEREIAEAEDRGFEGDRDPVVVDGRISDCRDSVVLGLLESEVYPSGLSRRVKAAKDDRPLPRCRYGR